EIWDGAAELKDGADKLKDGTAELSDGVSEMKDGVGEMRDETGDMDAQLEKEIEKLLEEYGGRDFDPISFVSAQNRVESVQFVLKTADIEAPETPEKKAPLEEAGSVWQRIVALARHWQQFTDAIRSWFA
ncbi:MAG: hypothetical protein GX572_02235, partial [Clostridia bacterium]|nr:hypothetical protein [Clostridia bacterium]